MTRRFSAGKRLVVIIIAVVVLGSLGVGLYFSDRLPVRSGAAVGLIYIDGPIAGGRSFDGLVESATGGDDIVDLLAQAREDDSIRAVVLRMNTPGGSAAAAQEIGAEIRRLREEGKVVVTSMSDLAASAGYWIASTTDFIVASPASLTGSIGVIMQLTNLVELYEKIGINITSIKSGPHKDIGSPARPLTEEEEKILQGLVDDIFQQFVDVVAEGRKLDKKKVLELADGRIFTGQQARELNLVDQLGTLQDAIDRAAELAGLQEFDVLVLESETPLERLIKRFGLTLRSLLNSLVPGRPGGAELRFRGWSVEPPR